MLKFYHAPQSRSAVTLWLLEELEVTYETVVVDIRADGGAPEDYRNIQPNKKVPAIEHDGVVVTERAAIGAYLADAFPDKGLAPPIGDPRRGPYLSWLVYVDAVADPVMVAHAQGWKYQNIGVSYGAFDDMVAHVERTLEAHPYVVGEAFTAADVSLGTMLHYGINIARQIPEKPVFQAYLGRVAQRPGFQRFMSKM
jgi:glutathione S-transferase